MSGAGPGTFPRHGGDLAFASARYGTPAEGWLDLSTGINPRPYPLDGVDGASLTSLPQASAVNDLLAAAAAAYGLPPGVPLIATPGSEIALRLLPTASPLGRVAVISPTYAGHAEAWRNAGRTVVAAPTLAGLEANVAIVVVGNPNNPDGRLTPLAALRETGDRLAAGKGLLIVDEAFADLAPDVSLAPHLDRVGAIVLRSFGKFFGLPGVRLGFAAGAPVVIARLAALMGDWPVSTTAIAVGIAALRDRPWQRATRTRLAADAVQLRSLLGKHGYRVVGGTDLFLLVEAGDAVALHERLARRGIWTRAFSEQPTWLRLGLPPDDRGFARLDGALSGR